MISLVLSLNEDPDLAYLHQVAREVTLASKVSVGESIPGGGINTTGFDLRVPGGTRNFYPAFWIRDAAMMLGADLVPQSEIDGWVKVVARVQPGPAGLTFGPLKIPPYSIPDHITLSGVPCWFPGAYANQGVGDYGYLPPADDAFYFIQMVICGTPKALNAPIRTAWSTQPLIQICKSAFASVAVNSDGLVFSSDEPGYRRVDWGFCDSITKTGLCLMPSLLRWQAAGRLAQMCDNSGDSVGVAEYRYAQRALSRAIAKTFFLPISDSEGMMFSATGLGHKDDIWASAFAIWLGVLPDGQSTSVATHLAKLYSAGSITREGQVRELPMSGPMGGSWDAASSSPGTYQNGGYWGTATGWLYSALKRTSPELAKRLLGEYVSYLKSHRAQGAPFEWINPNLHIQSNANYGSSAGLVYISIVNGSGFGPHSGHQGLEGGLNLP